MPLILNRVLPTLIFLPSMVIILSSCATMKEPEFRQIEQLKLKSFSFETSTLTMSLHYYNPNKSGLKLKNAEGDAWADEQFLGHFTIDTLVNIAPHSEFNIPVNMQVVTGSLLKTSLLSLGNREILFRVEGKAKIGKGSFFIRYPIRYQGTQRLSAMLGF
jgi:LEA14-like dessication related protein